ncbi:SigE family RNA polymerase sigma factor [Actinoplanes friuliensis]|jgi:RNA polymerase sigma-70 factor (sigma-E family)|uniref:Putative RNA polymerase ECF-subfamily sigma factor n=1 Tax=Actinoplanes friuliensis DSM 7358 TaxID=1246995 RepID=U5W9V4_9ACTN|nr:SigE family RNA polymerase sigma factor [Actinoplanes friuliensis]AGZ45802.1 putative RNA polymerase ECF-subfamily sigma factor [Actinoplanes friuliensis DSM 7358]
MANGSDAEYTAYVHGRATALRRTAYLLCGDEHQADDLVQETITKLYARWPKISRQAENLDSYVHTILVRIFLDEKRRGWWKVRLGIPPDRPAPVVPAHDVEERAVLRTALSQVPPRQQAVLVLRFLCDQPIADVARVLGCSEGTVKSQTAHGLTALRRILGDRIHTLGSIR